jgi:hypothetical protein
MNPPFTQSLIEVIEKFVAELVQIQFDQRKATPQAISTHYLQFEKDYMSNYSTESEYVTHVTIRHLLKWVFENQASLSDPSAVVSAIKYIAPSIVDEDPTTVSAVTQSLILTGAGVKPTVNANVNLLPHQTGFNLSSNIVRGQLAYNETDNIWYIRVGNSIVDLRVALDLQISHIEGLQEALEAASIGGYTFNDPLTSDVNGNVNLKYDTATLGIDGSGRLAVKDGVGNFLSTALPGTFTNDQIVIDEDKHLLILEHGKNTTNVKLHLRDNTGKEIFIPYDPTTNPNQVTVDFGGPIEGTWTYILEYWTGQSNGQYPDPIYAPSTHNHDSSYALKDHTHTGFAPSSHNHDDRYPLKSHNHDQSYAALNHNHDLSYEPKQQRGSLQLNLLGGSNQVNTDEFSAYYDGKIMTVYMKVSFLSNYVTNRLVKIGSIPTFPPIPVEFPGSHRDTSLSQSCFGRIENGNIYVQSGIGSRTGVFNFSFPFANLILP